VEYNVEVLGNRQKLEKKFRFSSRASEYKDQQKVETIDSQPPGTSARL